MTAVRGSVVRGERGVYQGQAHGHRSTCVRCGRERNVKPNHSPMCFDCQLVDPHFGENPTPRSP